MKKKRILSALTSLAMIGTMVAGALPFSVSAATKDAETTMNLGLTTTAPTSYAEGTYENGLEIPVSVVVNNYDEAEMYTGLQCNVAGPEGVKIKSMSIPGNSADRKDPNFEGNWFSCVGGDGYSNRDFKCSVTPDTAYTPGFSLMSQSGLKPFTQNTYTKQGDAIAKFVAVFEPGLAPGKYDIDFTFLAGVNSNDVNLTLKYVPTGEKLTIELGGDTEPTEATTEAPTEAPTTEKPQVPTDKEFVGDVDLYFDQKEAAPGEEVEIGVKADTHGKSLLGIEFKYAWDKKLSLVPGSGVLGFGFDAGATVGEGTYILGEQVAAPNDPDEYMVSFKFKVPSDAKPGDVYEIGASGTNGHVDPTFTITKKDGKYQQLTPVIKTIGKITVAGETEDTTEKPQVPTDKEFVGDVDLYFDQKEAAPGEEVEIGVKADTHGKSLLGIEFKYAWDKKLSLVPGSGVLGFGFDAGATVGEGTYILGEQVAAPNDPDEYMVSFKFKVPSDAKPGDVYEIGASGTNGHVDPTFTITNQTRKYPQLTPVIKTIGKITIVGETEETTEVPTTEKPEVPTDKEFVGDADIYFDQKEAAPGEEVEIGVKVDTHGQSLLGIEFKYAWDKELSLVPKSGVLGFGFDAGATVGEGTYVLGEQVAAPNDPDEYMVSFKFKVPSDAKPGDVYEIGASGTNGHVDPTFTITKKNGKYQQLTPVIKQIGKITIVGETEETTEVTTTAKPTTTTKTTTTTAKPTTTTKPVTTTTDGVTDKPVTVTSVSQVVVTETVISQVVVTETSVSKVVVTETSVSKVIIPSTETEISKVIVTETSVSKVVVTETSVSKVVVTETSVSKVIIPSTETEISKVVVTETSISKVVVTETSISKILIPSTETEISKIVVTETSISKVVVTDVSVVTVTSISIVVVTETSISSVVTTETGEKPSTDITVDVSGVDPSADNGQWYHTDDQVFVKDGIKVLFDGKDITADAEIIFDETPASVYDSKTHAEDYTVKFTVKYQGAEATAEIPVKIGVRGDSKVNSEVDVFDAIRIAQYTVKRQQIVEGSFDAFRSDVNESGEIDVFDAVAIAKYTVSRDANPWVKIITNYNNIITKEAK